MKKINVIFMVVLLLMTAACSYELVPPASKGKKLTTSGYSLDILEPGMHTLWGRDKLILLQTNTQTYQESVKIILQDKLTITASVRFRGRIAGSAKVITSMFNDIKPGKDNIVDFNEVYAVYGRMAVRNKTREMLSKYNVEDIHKNYARLSGEVSAALLEKLKKTPLEISDIAIGNIAYPDVVTNAVSMAKERKMAIEKEEAQAQIELTKKKNERLLAEADYQIEITRAKAIRDKNKIIGEGITPALLKLRQLEVMEKMTENKNSVFMPYDAMMSTAAQMRMYKK